VTRLSPLAQRALAGIRRASPVFGSTHAVNTPDALGIPGERSVWVAPATPRHARAATTTTTMRAPVREMRLLFGAIVSGHGYAFSEVAVRVFEDREAIG
jgi:hypothetical protein